MFSRLPIALFVLAGTFALSACDDDDLDACTKAGNKLVKQCKLDPGEDGGEKMKCTGDLEAEAKCINKNSFEEVCAFFEDPSTDQAPNYIECLERIGT